MELRSFGVCQACAELYPSTRGCPSCDDDHVSARIVAEARTMAHAAEAPQRYEQRRRAGRPRRAQQLAIGAGLCVTAALGTVLLLVV